MGELLGAVTRVARRFEHVGRFGMRIKGAGGVVTAGEQFCRCCMQLMCVRRPPAVRGVGGGMRWQGAVAGDCEACLLYTVRLRVFVSALGWWMGLGEVENGQFGVLELKGERCGQEQPGG